MCEFDSYPRQSRQVLELLVLFLLWGWGWGAHMGTD